MSIKVESTTDTQSAVTAASGSLAKEEKVEAQSASTEVEAKAHSEDETTEESDASEKKEAKDSEESEAKDDESNDKQKGENKGVRKRIDKLTKRVSAAEQEKEYWREQALKSRDSASKVESPKSESKSSDEGKPNPDNFETHEKYVEALADWKVDQKLSAQKAKERDEQLKKDFSSRIESHQERVQTFVKSHDDFEEVLEDVDDIVAQVAIKDLILDSENGPELMYELAKNRKEFERINSLSPMAAVREIGKFEARLAKESESKSETKETKTTKAAKPLSPVSSKASGSLHKSPEDMDFKEYKRWRQQQA